MRSLNQIKLDTLDDVLTEVRGLRSEVMLLRKDVRDLRARIKRKYNIFNQKSLTGRPRKKFDELRALQLRSQGESYRQICKEIDVSMGTLTRFFKQNDIKTLGKEVACLRIGKQTLRQSRILLKTPNHGVSQHLQRESEQDQTSQT